ncbi:MAG TPA: twin-arginine translocase subunit TatC [Chloroflexota bacterium]|jgi:sec-independent protein translocase protein TatC|nr:twin-arginine translocase subunit TatC [Chloroflexota bacterium]
MASVLRSFLSLNDPDPKEMTIVEHLEELRRRLVICIAVVTAGSFVGWFFKESAFNFLTVPLKPFTGGKAHHVEFILTKLTDAFVVELKISIAIGVALVLPVLLYQTWMFVAPAVAVHARHYVVPFVLLGIGLFIAGAGVGYALFPRVVQFLVSQQSSLRQAQFLLTVGDYVSQFALVMLIFGAVFELPVVLTFLAMIGAVSSRFLRAKRRYAGMIGLVMAMIITPGADPITPFVTAAVVYLLYEFSIILVRAIHR